jgi:tetratricopeptide (TPR) repeat protein
MRSQALLPLLWLFCSSAGAPALAAGKGKAQEAAAAAAASKEQAKKLFEKGMLLYDLRKFDQAIEQFDQAYQLYPQPAFLYNIAQAHRLAGRGREAIGFYQNYLRRMPDAPNRAEVEGHIAALTKEAAAGSAPGARAAEPPSGPPLRPPPAPAPYPEARTGQTFLTRVKAPPPDGQMYALTGTGARTYMGFSLYGVGLYVEEEPARRAYPRLVTQAGGTDLLQLTALDLAQTFIVLGEFGKMAVMRFTRDISAARIRDSYKDMLKDNLSSKAPEALRRSTEAFVALFDRDMKKGEELILRTSRQGQIFVTAGGTTRTGPTDPRLVLDLWNCWLGKKPVSEELKRDLVRRISGLGL